MKKDLIVPATIAVIALIVALIMHYSGVDMAVHNAARSMCVDTCTDVSGWVTRLGDGWLQVIICCVCGIFYYRKTNYQLSKLWFYAAPLSLIAGAMGQVLKFLFGRPRPKMLPEMYDFQWLEFAGGLRGFPSGHTLTSFVIVAIVSGNYPLKGKAVLFTLATLVGLSRITTNAHFAADVVFGAALGYFFGILLKTCFNKGLKTNA
jgi:undecaprenyl-diphosphatase